MTDSPFGPRENEADDRTRVSYPRPAGAPHQPPAPAAQQPAYAPTPPTQQPPMPPQPTQQGFGPYQGGQYPRQPQLQAPRQQAGYFRSLFDLSYENLGAPKFARVFQLLFMIVSGLVVLFGIVRFAGFGSFLPLVLGLVVLPLAWLLLNTLVRLILEAVVGIVQTAENSEEMLAILRNRERA